MSIADYQCLFDHNETQLSLGVQLPYLIEQGLAISTKQLHADALHDYITDFCPVAGWVCYRDKVEISHAIPTRLDLLEAEYTNATSSLTIKHQYADEYIVIEYKTQPINANKPQVYRELTMIVRDNLMAQATKAHYRIWYQQHVEGAAQGKWQAIAQQFMGFSQ